MKTATEKGVEAVAIFATDPHAFSERVSIKMDSGTEREKAREEAFSELFNQEG